MQPTNPPERRSLLSDSGTLADSPSGGRGTQIFCGIIIALIPIIYGIHCIDRGWTPLFGSRASSMKVRGLEGQVLAVAYMAIGAFCHFHWYWGLHPRLYRYSQFLKKASLIVLLITFLWVLFTILSWSLPIE